MQGSSNGILCGPVGSVCELMWGESVWEAGFDVLLNKPLKALHYNWGKCNRTVVVKTTDGCFLR